MQGKLKIKHIWFDFSDTLALVNKKIHNELRYQSYAKIIGKPEEADYFFKDFIDILEFVNNEKF